MKWLVKLIHAVDKKDRHYVSDMDQFLQKFDAEHPEESPSQQREIAKHKDIFNRTTSSRIKWD